MSGSLYDEAHIAVAAIRVHTHVKAAPPTIEDICQLLAISLEKGNRLCRKLGEAGIIENVQGAFGPKLFVKNHLAIEELPRDEPADALQGELKKFNEERKQIRQKVEAIQAKQAEKQKALFAEIEKKLKAKKEARDK